jgi:hypothetical protein
MAITNMSIRSSTSQLPSGVRTIVPSGPSPTITKSAITTTSASTTVLSTPTFTPLSACPTANNTIFISTISNTSSLIGLVSNTTVPAAAGVSFTRYCDANTPADFKPLSSGFVYTLDDCIELCAAYSVYTTGAAAATCNVAVYDVEQARPVNCVIGSTLAAANSLGIDGGLAVALLEASV